MIHAYFLDRYFTGFKLAYASPTVVPDDGTTTDTLLGIFAAGISAPNVETATFAVQAVLSADDSCDPEVRAMGALCARVCCEVRVVSCPPPRLSLARPNLTVCATRR